MRKLPWVRSMTPLLFRVTRRPVVNGVMLPCTDVSVLLPSMLNTPVPLVLSPSCKLSSRSNREPLIRLTVSQLM
ncbi:hypothetical protein D3C71_1073380 [compost metagenome]